MRPTISSAKKGAWKALSRFIRKRDARCVTCGRTAAFEELDCGHYKRNSERNKLLGGNELWFRQENFGAQCTACNRFRNGQPVEMALYLTRMWGHDILEKINVLYNTPKKWTIEEIIAIEEHYKELTEAYES